MPELDASIPLSVRPPVLPTAGDMLGLQDMAIQLQEHRAQQVERQKQGIALQQIGQIAQDPNSIDPSTGLLTQNAVGKIMGLDVNAGLKMQENMLKQQDMAAQVKQRTAEADEALSKIKTKQVQMAHDITDKQLTYYNQLLQTGKYSPEEAQRLTDKFGQEEHDKLVKSGELSSAGFSQKQIDGGIPKFDPEKATAQALTFKDYLNNRTKQKEFDEQEQDRKTRLQQGQEHINIQVQTAENRKEAQQDLDKPTLSPEAIKRAAIDYNATQKLPPNLGRGKQGAANTSAILDAAADLNKGKSENDVIQGRAQSAASTKSLAKLQQQFDNVSAFEANASQQGNILVGLAHKVDATGIPVAERWIRAGRRALAGDPDVSEFDAQIQTFRNEAAKILTSTSLSGQTTDSARHEVETMLNGSMSADQITRVVQRLQSDFKIRTKTLGDQINKTKSQISGGGDGGTDFSHLWKKQ